MEGSTREGGRGRLSYRGEDEVVREKGEWREIQGSQRKEGSRWMGLKDYAVVFGKGQGEEGVVRGE